MRGPRELGEARLISVAVSLLGLSNPSCRTMTPSSPSEGARAVEVRPPSDMAEDFHWRQRVTVRYGVRPPRTFDAVLEKRGNLLRLVGLTPMKTVLFVVEARGAEVRFENRTGEPLPFGGSHILRDVQRAFFPWIHTPYEQGRRTRALGRTRVTERARNGRLVERTFETAGEGVVQVLYEGTPDPPGGPPPRVTLFDLERGYRLEIATLSAS